MKISDHLQVVDSLVSTSDGNIRMRIWKPLKDSSINKGRAFNEPESVVKKEPIILFHDSLGCIDLWREFPALLAEKTGRTVVAYDRLGYGQSDPRTDNLIESTRAGNSFIYEEAQKYFPLVLQAVREQLLTPIADGVKSSGAKYFDPKYTGPVILYGHSVGGAMALIASKLLGPECKAVITEAAQMFVEDKTLEGIRAAKKLNDPDGTGAQAHVVGATVTKLEKYHGKKAQWVFDAWTETWLSSDFAHWSMIDFLSQVSCPVLAFHGDRDEYGSLRHPEMICGSGTTKPANAVNTPDDEKPLVHKKIILKDCGHIPHREYPELVLEEIQNFLDDLNPPL